MFRGTIPARGKKTTKTPSTNSNSKHSGRAGTSQINRLKTQLINERKKLSSKQNTRSHISALENSHKYATDANKVRPLSNNQFDRLSQSKGDSPLLHPAVGNTTVEQQALKVGGYDTRPHVRSIWYMTPVDGISDTPTATGRLPHEYHPTKFFIPDPQTTPQLKRLAKHPKVRIKTTAFTHLTKEEQNRALKALDLPHPDKIHRHEPYPHLHYFTAPTIKDKSPVRLLKLSGGETRAFRSPKLAVTAFSINQVPRLRHHTRDVEVVFVGRSNVGKSSLINALTHSDLAKTGRTPGKTQSLNFYALHPEALRAHRTTAAALSRASTIDTDRIYNFVSKLDPALTLPLTMAQESTINACYKRAGNGPVMMLVDVPGYGHANAPDWIVDKWNVMLGSYLRLRSPLNFPTDDEKKWTTKEYLEELGKLRKNRAQPRRKSPKNGLKTERKSTSRDKDADGGDWDEFDNDGDYDDDDEASDAWESDFEQDPLKLFETALSRHVDQMKYHLERRVADYETIMSKFNELEELERGLQDQETKIRNGERVDKNLLYDPVLIQQKRIELLKLQGDLRAQIANEDPLNATVTNLPTGEWDDESHLKLREANKAKITDPSLNRYKRLLTQSKSDITHATGADHAKVAAETHTVQTESSPNLSSDIPTATTVITKRPNALRVKPRITTRATTSETPSETPSETTQAPPNPDEIASKSSKYLKTNFDDELKQIQAEIDGVINTPEAERPVAPRQLRQLTKRASVRRPLVRHVDNDDDEDDKDDDDDEDPLELMKAYRKTQLLETQLNTHSQNRFQPVHTRLPPLEHLGPLHGSPLKNVVVLLDARSGVTKYDLQFFNFLEKFHITHQVVLTKIDRMTTPELEGAAYSVAQALFPHEFVKLLQKTQPLNLSAFPEGKLPSNSPTFTIKSAEQDKLWESSLKYAPRQFCSPMLIGVSSEKRLNIDVLQRALLHGIFERI